MKRERSWSLALPPVPPPMPINQATVRRQLINNSILTLPAHEVILQLMRYINYLLAYLLSKLMLDTFSGGVVCLEVVVDAGVGVAVLERHYGQFGVDAM